MCREHFLTVVAQDVLVQYARLALVPHVGDPYGPDADAALRGLLVKVVPERLIQLL
jgi:hypothetical protein